MARSGRVLAAVAIAVLLMASAKPSEYEIKAAFLYNFTKFVEWPEGTFAADSEPFVLAVLGQDPFGKDLDSVLAGKTFGDRELVIRRYADLDELQGCHLLFISEALEGDLDRILDRLGSSRALTVSEFRESVTRGVMIGFKTVGKKVRFDINAGAADSSSLKISSRLLALAGTVIDADNL